MIVKNESQHLAACLDTVKDWVDEIVILDSGSTDNTEEIARRYTGKYYVNADWPGFGKQRQLAQQYVESEYILWLDADERVSETLRQSIQSALLKDPAQTCYRINRLSYAFGKFIRHSGWYPDYVLRLHRRDATRYNDALVHESLILPKGYQVETLQGDLLHYTFDNLSQYTRKTAHYMKAWTDQREGRKRCGLTGALLHGFFRFCKMYFLKCGFLDGRHGLLLAILSANTTFTRYADLWLRDYVKQQPERKQGN
jgi:(heptosyl)LPS beta-1,4-glucosyltransferase